jgi:hypothetical protein
MGRGDVQMSGRDVQMGEGAVQMSRRDVQMDFE